MAKPIKMTLKKLRRALPIAMELRDTAISYDGGETILERPWKDIPFTDLLTMGWKLAVMRKRFGDRLADMLRDGEISICPALLEANRTMVGDFDLDPDLVFNSDEDLADKQICEIALLCLESARSDRSDSN